MAKRRSKRAREGEEPASASRRRHTPEQRRAAIEAYERSGQTQKAFAANYGITATTLVAWLRAYRAGGAKGLERISPGPARRRGRAPLAPAKRGAIEEVKRRFPTFGLRKVRDFLARFSGLRVSTGSVAKTLRTAGLSPPPPRRKRKPAPPRRFERRPGELWQSDITYLNVPWSRRPLYLVAFLDDFSRYVVAFGLHLQQRQEIAIEALLLGISRFGKPKEVLTDQGRQYYAWRGKNDFQKLLAREGIAHVIARAHHPETVGKCERFWETLKSELWDRVQPKDLDDARARLGHFLGHYNHFRPHQALEGLTPADRFFGGESEVRAAIETEMGKNELLIALGETPRKSLFLVGQIGDRSLSLHGERGRVVVQTSDGMRSEMEIENLGAPPRRKEEGDERGTSTSRDGAGVERAGAASPHGAQAHEVPGAAEDAVADPSALGGRERGGADVGAPGGGGDPVRVAGQDEPRGGGGAAVDAAASVLAAVAAGGGGDGGGAAASAAGAPRTTGGDGEPGERGRATAEEAGRAAGAGAVGGTESDRDPSRAACAPRCAGEAGGEPQCPRESQRDGGGAGR
jgi:transposase InsO family protein